MESASMSQAKGKISELVARVAKRGERILLTSRGRPKAALVSIEDLERLQASETKAERDFQSFIKDLDLASEIRNQIFKESGGILRDSADLIREMRDERDEQILGLR
jgi:prevent-host-death family protein